MPSELDRSLDCAARLIGDIPAAIALFDRQGRYVAASAPWIEAFGLPRTPLAGYRHDEVSTSGPGLADVQRRTLAGESVDDCLIDQAGARVSARLHRATDGEVVGIVVLRPHEKSSRSEAAIALPDPLAGLADREEFVERLRQALADGDVGRPSFLAFAINLDSFRNLSNLQGADTAERVEEIIAERLLAATRSRAPRDAGPSSRPCDMIARLGAGEFGVVCAPPAPPAMEAESLAERLLRLVQSPIAVGDDWFRLDASIGSMVTTPAHQDPAGVLRDLDVALQRARALGPGKIVAWDPMLTRDAARHYTMAEQLRRAFENHEFTLHYQPVLRLDDNRMVGAEALLRWNNPTEGLVPSEAFLPVLEETGLIVEAGVWIVREVVRQLESWRTLYGRDIVDWITFKLSLRQFGDPATLLAALRSVHYSGFPVHRLMLEVSAAALARSPAAAPAVLGQLRALGIQLAVADFGTGSASLNALRLFPFDLVKIAAGFTAQIGTAEGDRLLGALLDIARLHRMTVLAAGVETAAQRDFLYGSGCDLAQGYLFGQPIDGALLGAHALTHTSEPSRGARRARPAGVTSPTSAGRSRAG